MDNDNGSPNETARSIVPIDLGHEMQTSFIAYAMAVIINRALPDVRDGLKPVHRRILYGMRELNMLPDKPYRKSARLVGDVLGKYHPHGDSAVYDAMVRLAQDFSMRHMLVDGHGNFGSVDGDGAAAMRYTEARLAKITLEMLRDIDKDTVEFYPNFDDTEMQPSVLPARFPNLLVNGTGGIAVGMATNIPPHNLAETINATIAVLDNPDIGIDELIEILPGPDFPTGGIVCGVSGIHAAYKTGRGRIRVRARSEILPLGNDREQIIVSEIPYQVNKATLVAKIADLVHAKTVEGISALRDETDKSGMRIVIELKRGANATVVLNQLYKHTQLQDTFGVIMLALVDGEPRVLTLKQVLEHYIDHQKDVIIRRTKFELEKAQKRAHILEGLLIALDHIDEVVNLIRSSKDAPTARARLMERFGLSEAQAQAILDMRLQRLTGLERDKIQAEYDELMQRIQHLQLILQTPQMVVDIIKEDLIQIRDKYADARRTEITYDEDEINLDELIAREDMVVTLTHYGYVKRISLETYKSQKRGGRGISAMSTREEDFAERVFVTSTHNYLLFFTNRGKAYLKKCYQIPEASRTAKGTPIVNLLQLEQDEKVTAVVPVSGDVSEDTNLLFITRSGKIKKTPAQAYRNIRQVGLKAINLNEGDELVAVLEAHAGSDVVIGTRNGMAIVFPESNARPMGRSAAGVKGINLREGDFVIGAGTSDEGREVLVVTENGYGKRTSMADYRHQSRGGYGVKSLNITEKTGAMCGLKIVNGDEEIMLISDQGIVIRVRVDEIPTIGRSTQGVKIMRTSDDTRVVWVEKFEATEAEEGAEGEEAPTEVESTIETVPELVLPTGLPEE